MTQTQPKSKKKTWIPWAGFLLIGVPLMIWAIMTPDQEKVVAEEFLDALEAQAYDDAFNLLSDNAQRQYGDSIALQRDLPIDKWITYNRDDGDHRNDAIDASARFNGQDRKSLRIYLVQNEADEWRVERVDGLR